MRTLIVFTAAWLTATAVSAQSPPSTTVREAFGHLFPISPVDCPDERPDGCVCGEIDNGTSLPMAYSRVESCRHPVFQGVKNMKMFDSEGALINDVMLKNGHLHGATVSWHPNGRLRAVANYEAGRQNGYARIWHDNGNLEAEQSFVDGQAHGRESRYARDGSLEAVIVWNLGELDREATRALSRSLGIETPFDRAGSPAADKSQDDSE